MNTLYDIHSHKDNFELISMIESAENYTPECIQVIHTILDERQIPSKLKSKLIREVNQSIARKNLLNQNLSRENIHMHSSQFLNPDQVKSIYKSELKKIIKEQKDFRFDAWSYIIGGI